MQEGDDLRAEVAFLLIERGDLQQAYEVLVSMPKRGEGTRTEWYRALHCGMIKHAQWKEVGALARCLEAAGFADSSLCATSCTD